MTITNLLTDDLPVGLALTSLVGSYYSAEDVAQCFINLHQVLGTKASSPLTFHFPEAPEDQAWVLSSKFMWWHGLALPFKAYSNPLMERRIVIFNTEFDTTPEFRVVDYEMNVTKISISGLRFKVYDNPEMWVMAYQTVAPP